MKVFFLTFLITLALVILCVAFIGIGKLLTGKNKFTCKRCGKPEKKDSCQVCGKTKSEAPEESDQNSAHSAEDDY